VRNRCCTKSIPPPPSIVRSNKRCKVRVPTHGFCVPKPRAVGTVVLNRGKAPTFHSSSPPLTSRYHSDITVMSDFSQVNTEVCSVCKTSYPRCLTCEKYGKKDKHSLDREKAMNAHDNSSYINDEGKSQPHWNRKESK
jgi:hypothetical protein